MENYNTDKEVWKAVEGYEGRYEVSNFGRVKSLERKVLVRRKNGHYINTVPEKILKPTLSVGVTGGYPTVKLMMNNKGKTVKVHRLVAQAFIPNPNNYQDVNHKDEDKTNNHISNLEWCSRRYNNEYGTRKKRIYSHPNFKKTMKDLGKKRSKPVKATNIKTGEIRIYKSMLDAEKDGFYNQNISRVCRGKAKTHKGYTWELI